MSKSITAPSLLLASTLALLMSACMSSPAANGSSSGRMVADGSSFAMQPGETVMLSDRSTLRYVSVKSDSRCRPDVQCIQAGNAVLAFQSMSGGSAQSFELNSPDQPQSRDLGSMQVTLESLTFGEKPQAQLKVERGN